MNIRIKLTHFMNYKQLIYEQKVEIYALLKAGLNQTTIAQLIGVSKSMVNREIKQTHNSKTILFFFVPNSYDFVRKQHTNCGAFLRKRELFEPGLQLLYYAALDMKGSASIL
jgi:IS30 family transposase